MHSIDVAYCYIWGGVVCLCMSVSVSVMTGREPSKTDEPIEWLLGGGAQICDGLTKHC